MPFYLLPAFATGVLLSFALPFVPPPAAWAAVFCCAAAALLRWKRAGLLLLLLLVGAAYGVWRTELALAQRWPSEKQGETL